jgi:hypothetical protein
VLHRHHTVTFRSCPVILTACASYLGTDSPHLQDSSVVSSVVSFGASSLTSHPCNREATRVLALPCSLCTQGFRIRKLSTRASFQ